MVLLWFDNNTNDNIKYIDCIVRESEYHKLNSLSFLYDHVNCKNYDYSCPKNLKM